jgi:hypothetical protein
MVNLAPVHWRTTTRQSVNMTTTCNWAECFSHFSFKLFYSIIYPMPSYKDDQYTIRHARGTVQIPGRNAYWTVFPISPIFCWSELGFDSVLAGIRYHYPPRNETLHNASNCVQANGPSKKIFKLWKCEWRNKLFRHTPIVCVLIVHAQIYDRLARTSYAFLYYTQAKNIGIRWMTMSVGAAESYFDWNSSAIIWSCRGLLY